MAQSAYQRRFRKMSCLNVTDPKEAGELLEKLPLGRAGLMEFQLIPLGRSGRLECCFPIQRIRKAQTMGIADLELYRQNLGGRT
jgi:hypothetical protein